MDRYHKSLIQSAQDIVTCQGCKEVKHIFVDFSKQIWSTRSDTFFNERFEVCDDCRNSRGKNEKQ